jgi:carboxyl-terminal processing protease
MTERRSNNSRIAVRTRKMRAHNVRLLKILSAFIVLCLVFLLGFAARGNTALMSHLGFNQTQTGAAATDASSQSKKNSYNSVSSRVSEVEDVLSDDSLDSYSLDSATTAVLDAFGTASNDPYLRYYSPARYESLLNNADDSYAGVGVLFSEYNGKAYAVDVFEGSDAQLSGVEEGDFVVSIDGDSSQSWSRSEVAAALSKKAGESVVITWRRPESLTADGGEEFTTTLDCAEYSEPNVTTSLENGVGYIQLKQFTQNAESLVEQAISSLDSQGADAYVLDLRNNPGGYLTQAVSTASLFMQSGTVVQVRTKDGTSTKSATGNPVTNEPLVVITNGNTAAAAEVLAAALSDSQRATIVGETTLGKGTVQVIRKLSFGGAMRYTAAYYLTPKGNTIDQVGVTPDVVVRNSSDDTSSDAQKDYAMEYARSLRTS